MYALYVVYVFVALFLQCFPEGFICFITPSACPTFSGTPVDAPKMPFSVVAEQKSKINLNFTLPLDDMGLAHATMGFGGEQKNGLFFGIHFYLKKTQTRKRNENQEVVLAMHIMIIQKAKSRIRSPEE